MAKPWSEIRGVREAILDATAALVTEQGLPAVTIERIAERTGFGRATVDKYFPDVDAILRAWHDRQVTDHLGYLADIGNQPGDPLQRLDAVLRAYAAIAHQTDPHRATELGASVHRGDHALHARRQLLETVRNLLAEGARTGHIRDDVTPDELANYCLHAMSAAGGPLSTAAIRRLVDVTLAGLRRP